MKRYVVVTNCECRMVNAQNEDTVKKFISIQDDHLYDSDELSIEEVVVVSSARWLVEEKWKEDERKSIMDAKAEKERVARELRNQKDREILGAMDVQKLERIAATIENRKKN